MQQSNPKSRRGFSRPTWLLGSLAASIFVVAFWYWQHWTPDEEIEYTSPKKPAYQTLNISGVIKQSDRKGWFDVIEADDGTNYYLDVRFPLTNILENPSAPAPKKSEYLWGDDHGRRILIAGAKVRTSRGCQEIFEGEKVALSPEVNATP